MGNKGGRFDQDPWEQPAFKRWKKHVEKHMAPGMRKSGMVMSLYPSDGKGDAEFWAELGCAICLDKPIICMVQPGSKASKKMMTVADEIIECDPNTDEGRKEIAAALERLAEKYGKP